MKFKVLKASDWEYETEIEVYTVDELITWIDANANGCIILSTPKLFNGDAEIKIYDTYVE